MKNFLKRLKRFFFPPAGTPLWIRALPYAVLGGLTLLVLVGGAYAWDYTNSPEFCGTACHTMPPEYTAYLTSPHARVDCVDCHIGKGFIATRITRKAGDLRHVIATAFKTYEFPIRAHELRPARETCERCHFPEKFSDDSLRERKQFANDQANTPSTLYLVLKTGGGSARLGLGRGIHWHIENKILYLSLDPEDQEIPYVRVQEVDGSTTEYIDIEAGFDPASIDEAALEEMDCATCHNRITHLVYTPEQTVDRLLERGVISADIPEIRRKAVEVYSNLYESVDLGLNGIAGLSAYYQAYHPDFYATNGEDIEQTIETLQAAYRASVFPEQNSDWTTHPNNIGHKDSPGCFRCHDGKHLNAEQEAIRLECNLCHSIPVTAGPDDFVADIEISRGPEPESHLNTNWISLHHDAYNDTCINCHSTENAGGTDNTSFCSNSACHGNVWEFAGFDAPALREILLAQLPPEPTPEAESEEKPLTFEATIGPLLVQRCGSCHGETGSLKGLNLTSYDAILQGGSGGPAISPGDPDQSLLVIKQSGEQNHFGQLSPEELELVRQWIATGAPEN
jgi:nitrate/TMAO reductase-like tetraheme cytochrome c subunit/mono/diheme cytochrome c family protein